MYNSRCPSALLLTVERNSIDDAVIGKGRRVSERETKKRESERERKKGLADRYGLLLYEVDHHMLNILE